MKFYSLNVLVELQEGVEAATVAAKILAQIETDGRERIVWLPPELEKHSIVSPAGTTQFPACLRQRQNRLEFQICLPTRKDLGRRWFLKRLTGAGEFRLIAMTDVSVVHVESGT